MKLTKTQFKSYVQHLVAARLKRYGAEFATGKTEVEYGIAEGNYIITADKWNTCIDFGFYIGE